MEKVTKKVIIYSTPTCHYCVQAKEFFDENKVKYRDFNVAENEKAREEMVKKSGQMGVPVIVIGNEIIVGFDKSKIKKVLKL
ncbi:glutaredoxin family protein [Candidatus Woesearchaeota archaeon]|nr:glutaredoxin family protein [Candidatus Woesearchaeota archaeon]